LRDASLKSSDAFPGGGLCNDIAVARDGVNDPKLRDQDPGPFRAVGVPYKTPG